VLLPTSLRRRLLVLAAHPDDETAGVGAILARCAEPGLAAVLILTDGVPFDPSHFAEPGRWSPAAYRSIRRSEALSALATLGLDASRVFFASIPDQRLAWHLGAGAIALQAILRQHRPAVVLTPAFEGGHPDHDAANFLAAQAQARGEAEVWEYPLYSLRNAKPLHFRFSDPDPAIVSCKLDASLWSRKAAALTCYASQAKTLGPLGCNLRETVRPLPAHDYGRPALAEPAVYEHWGWPITAAAVAEEFKAVLERASGTASLGATTATNPAQAG